MSVRGPWIAPRLLLGVMVGCVVQQPATTQDATIALASHQIALDRLGPDVQTATAVFAVDESVSIRVEIASNAPNIVTSLLGPGGQVVDESTVGSYGGEFAFFSGGPPEGPSILMTLGPGYHYVYTLPSLGPGAYVVHFAVPTIPTEDIGLITELTTDSPVAVGLFATESVISTGSSSVLVAGVYESGSAVAGASVLAAVRPPSHAAFNIALLDDGQGVDTLAGDGLYSGHFSITEAGEWVTIATVTGTNSHGTPFSRTSSTRVTALPGGARLTSVVFDHGVDDNGNGLIDRIVLDVGVAVTIPGDYRITGVLTTAGGQTMVARGHAELPVGAATIAADLSAKDVLAVGEDGPYTISEIQLDRDTPTGRDPNDDAGDGTQLTQPYLLTDFESKPLALTGINSGSAIDTDADGDYDLFEAHVGIYARVPGEYQYLARLVDPCGAEVESIRGQQVLPSGANPEALVLHFDGHRIGQDGTTGAYTVDTLAVSGPGGSFTRAGVASTHSLSAVQFDGFQTAPPDCDGDGIPDACALQTAHSFDCNGNGRPDECDIAVGTSGDCDADHVPDECQPLGHFPPWSQAQNVCADAEPICPGDYVGDTSNATNDGASSCDYGTPGKDVWYRYQPKTDGEVTISLCHSNFDTMLSVHTACPGTPGNEIACNDDACGHRSEVTTAVTANTIYFIRVAGATTRYGAFTMVVTGPPCSVGDCNANGTFDVCDVAAGTSPDCNANGRPDECDLVDSPSADCNHNGHLDACDVSAGTSPDCNANGRPDECDLADSPGADCNGNGHLDACDVAEGTSPDCNANRRPDACDVAAGTSPDCNGNGRPDECDVVDGGGSDCNGNAQPDECDIAAGTSPDCNANGHPDECDVVSGTSTDCDADGRPDECEVGADPLTSTAQDVCVRGQPICPGHTYLGTTSAASNDGRASCGNADESPEVWYRYTPASDGTLDVSLCGSSYDTVLSVHTGCPGTEDNELDCVDDACELQSEVSVDVRAGSTYSIRVSGYSGDVGDFTLTLSGPPCQSIDCNTNGILDACDLAHGTSHDCDGNHVPDDCVGVPSLTAESTPAGTTRLTWTTSAAATGYDVVRGSLNELAASSGDFAVATNACLDPSTPSETADDPEQPSAGQGYWYLVRGRNCSLAGTYDSGAASQVGTRDSEISASPEACP